MILWIASRVKHFVLSGIKRLYFLAILALFYTYITKQLLLGSPSPPPQMKAYFYQSNWFYILCVLLLTLAAFEIYRIRTRQLKKSKKKLEQLAEERTRQLEVSNQELEKFSIVARKTNNAITIMDAEGNIEWVNETFTRLTGFTKESFINTRGKNLLDASFNPNIKQLLKKSIEKKESVIYEINNFREGQEYWFQATLSPIFDAEGKLTQLVAISTDITELKKIQQQIKQQNEEMQKQSQELRDALQEARKGWDAAKAANQTKSEFLARMSHEIRTPMNGIIGFSDMLLETSLTRRQQDYVKTIRHSSEGLKSLINDILDFSKIETSGLHVQTSVFEPQPLIEDIFNMLLPKSEIKSLEMVYKIEDTVPSKIKADANRFRQVVTNLVGNAIKFTESGKIQLSMTVQNENNAGLNCMVTIQDTGIGIPKENWETIFNAFQQVDGSNTREYDGAGLGLSISRQIARLMGGDIQVESTLGKGSTFYLSIWVEKVEQEDPSNVPNQPKKEIRISHEVQSNLQKSAQSNRNINDNQSVETHHILLAEDNPINQKLARFILVQAGYRVTLVENGEDAVQAIEAKPNNFDLVLMDIQMPKQNGMDATRQIRKLEKENPTWRHLPIVALTAQNMSGDRKKCIDSGMDDYIAKPIKKERVLETIKKWLNK
jgi:PAS domain S-box-containing protein